MLETEGESVGFFPPTCTSYDEEELSVLPRDTKVIVTGNNRTKSVLVGLRGVVKKAVGLGGWHWLVLTNGVEVKLQRNALSVIEAPNNQDEEPEVEDPFPNSNALDDFPTTLKSSERPSKPGLMISRSTDTCFAAEICRSEIKADIEASSNISNDLPMVDLSKLETAALRRYRRHFKLVDVGPHSSKEQLLHAVGRHFMSQQMDELQVISCFMQATKRSKIH